MKLWNILMAADEEQTEGARIRIIFALVMLVGVALSGYGLYKKMQWTENTAAASAKYAFNSGAEQARLGGLVSNIKSVIAARGRSKNIVDTSFSIARYPFGAPVKEAIQPDAEQPQEILLPPPSAQELIEQSPHISVRGILRLDDEQKEVVAILNIDGEPEGKIYRAGSVYAEGKGKILKIEENKITVRYKGRNFTF